MAEKKDIPQPQKTSNVDTDIFIKGMAKDPNAAFVTKEQWSHARNAINNSADGDVGTLGNEPANLLCGVIPYTIIGTIHLYADKWVIFSTNNSISEIGTFDDSSCEYNTLVNDNWCSAEVNDDDEEYTPCLNFSTQSLITGASKENFDCTWQVYWDDGRNPSRTLNLDNIPWKQIVISEPDDECVIYENASPLCLDCEKLRLAPLIKTPCLELSKSADGGQLRNGSYQAFIAYTINDQIIGDYYGISNIQALHDHEDNISGLELDVSNLDKGFEYFSLVICSNNQMEMQAKQIGIYAIEQGHISIDYINQALKTIPIEVLPLRNPAYEKSDNMYVVNDYLIRQGPTEQFDFNYQPLANQIHVHWVSTQFPADYYKKGGNKPTFMRDEVYPLFIRFIYNTGERSSSYHIPGRSSSAEGFNPSSWITPSGVSYSDERSPTNVGDINNILDDDGNGEKVFETYNTGEIDEPYNATNFGQWQDPNELNTTNDGGVHIAEGHMAYWESTERYPNDPVRYNANVGDDRYDLCSKPIRHHKFPDESVSGQGNPSADAIGGPGGCLDRSSNSNQTINVLGIKLMNIQWPRYNANNDVNELCGELNGAPTGAIIPNIVGYEILVGAREGNKSIIAKGLTRNMREYDIPDNAQGHEQDNLLSTQMGLMANYPFNDLNTDPFLADGSNDGFTFSNVLGNIQNAELYGGDRSRGDCFTFHSPETSFNKPFLSPYEIKSYGIVAGTQLGRFKKSENHPQYKLLRNICMWIGLFVGMGSAINQTRGKKNKKLEAPKIMNIGLSGYENPLVTGTSTPPLLPAKWGAPYNAAADNADAISRLTTSPQIGAAGQAAATLANPLYIGAEGTEVAADTALTLASIIGAPKLQMNLPVVGYEATLRSASASKTAAMNSGRGYVGAGETIEYEGSRWSALPSATQLVFGLVTFMQFSATAGQEVIDLIQNLVSYQDYAFKYNGHGLYYNTQTITTGISRSRIEKARYVGSSMQQLTETLKINNIQRPSTVVIKSDKSLVLPTGDASKFTIGEVNGDGIYRNPTQLVRTSISAHYTGLKVAFKNQYGQLDQIKQLPIRGCVQLFENLENRDKDGNIVTMTADNYNTDINNDGALNSTGMLNEGMMVSGIMYGGDCYISRYTEKVIMPFFWDFLMGQPDGFPYDYRLRANVPRPVYWMNTIKYDLSELIRAITSLPVLLANPESSTALPSNLFVLDRSSTDIDSYDTDSMETPTGIPTTGDTTQESTGGRGLFHVKNGYMYTHCNGINDIFVETSLNIANRDYEDRPDKRFYDWSDYTDVDELFHADIIKKGNFYKYDPSLGKDRFFSQLISFGLIQPRDYDPIVSANCYMHYPKRLVYSLQAQKEAKKDFWRVFLPNNYKDFKNKVNVIKPVSKSGALILFPNLAPQNFQGVDQLQTDLGTKLTIGDGGLFGNPMQNVANADLSHEYGSCESQRSVINTPSGIFYISQAQGKIFQYSGEGLNNIANAGMKQWFNKYLPSRLLAEYPGMEDCQGWIDNPVAGVGCQSVYDPNYDIVYFCKKDYEPLVPECIDFVPCQGFVYNETNCDGVAPVPCCPEGYEYNPENPIGEECEIITQNPTTAIMGATPIDIVISIDSSNSVDSNGNVGNMQNFVNQFVAGLSNQLENDSVRIALCHFGAGRNTPVPLSGGQVFASNQSLIEGTADEMFQHGHQLQLTNNINVLNTWMGVAGAPTGNNSYVPDYNSIYGQSNGSANSNGPGKDDPFGTDLIAGAWVAQNLLYGPNSRDVRKISIIMLDGPQATINTSSGYYQSNQYIGGGVSGTDVYQEMPVNPVTPNVDIGPQNDDDWQNDSSGHWDLGRPGAVWFQENILNNSNYTSAPFEQEVYSILVDPGGVAPTQPYINYAAQFSNNGNAYSGSFTNQEDIQNIVEQIVANISTIEQFCEPPCVFVGTNYGPSGNLQGYCECAEFLPASYIDSVRPVSITDGHFFKDVSWTVSYDPKAKAWISFHDWHPDLTIPSYNHFLTTKTQKSKEPYCPEGYVFNQNSGLCEAIECPPGYEWNEEGTLCCNDIVVSPTVLNTNETSDGVGGTTFANPGFNLEPGDNYGFGVSPSPWNTGYLCTGASNVMTPDTNPGGLTTITLPPYEGDAYIGMLQSGNPDAGCGGIGGVDGPTIGTLTYYQEGVWQQLVNNINGPTSLTPGQEYVGSVALTQDSGHLSIGTFTYLAPALEIWGGSQPPGLQGQNYRGDQFGYDGNDTLGSSELLWRSPAVSNIDNWQLYNYQFTPSAAWDYIFFKIQIVRIIGEVPYSSKGASKYLLVDGLTAPVLEESTKSCECPEGMDMVLEEDLITPATEQDCLDGRRVMCIDTICVDSTIEPSYEFGGIWKHNVRCDLFANYYDKDHPWEVEWVETVGQVVNTVRSIEYQLESYIYKGNLDNDCGDRFHDLDWNFDEAILYNTEQVSGLLTLVLDPKNDVPLITDYPIITGNDIEILYSKEEQKYRFNQFWDITNDRGEFNPNANSSIFITQLNGYIRDLNQANLDYFKPAFQRKKFRHYWNKVILRKKISNNRKMLLKLANTKINMSFR